MVAVLRHQRRKGKAFPHFAVGQNDANCLFPDEVSRETTTASTVANPLLPPPVAEKRKLINQDDGAAITWIENDRSKRLKRCYFENRGGELIE